MRRNQKKISRCLLERKENDDIQWKGLE